MSYRTYIVLSSVLCRVFLRFLHALVTTNRDLFAGHGYFDPTIIDRPITDRTFARVHEFVSLEIISLPTETDYSRPENLTSRILLISGASPTAIYRTRAGTHP